MFMVGFAGETDFEDTLFIDIEQRNLGGVILFGHNLHNPVQISSLTADLKSYANTPLFIATDQEGGIVARLDENNGFSATHTAYQLGTIFNSEDSTRAQAGMMAQWLSESGINVNLGPVADVNVNPGSPAIGFYGRSFSADPQDVFKHVNWFSSEFSALNIVNTLKHFPGHGSAEQDSHLGFTDITQTWTEAELDPYRGLIDLGYEDMIMTGHLYNSNLDPDYPASLSEKTINDILRDSLGFTGVVVSDAMFMRAITNNYTFEEAIEFTINAGTDMLLYTTNEYEGNSLLQTAVNIVKARVIEGAISAIRIDDSYNRIMALKDKVSSLDTQTRYRIPDHLTLQIFPNPFNIMTTIKIRQKQTGPVRLNVFDITGRNIYSQNYNLLTAGDHSIRFDGSNLATGIYFVSLQSQNKIVTQKIMLLK
jgi:beta-N-acetylhexosaminidase